MGTRVMTGLKYYRITGPTDQKQPYQPGLARDRAWEHAGALRRRSAPSRSAGWRRTCRSSRWSSPPTMQNCTGTGGSRGRCSSRRPSASWRARAPRAAMARRSLAVTLKGYLDAEPITVEATPSASSWGAGGYGEVWVGPEAAWSWRHVHHATRYVTWLVQQHQGADGARGQALDQAIRELLLLQSSDWNFIIKTATSTRYAEGRIRVHTSRLRHARAPGADRRASPRPTRPGSTRSAPGTISSPT